MPGYIDIKIKVSLFDHLLTMGVPIWDELPKLCDPHLGGFVINIRKHALDYPADQPDDVWMFDFYEIVVRWR